MTLPWEKVQALQGEILTTIWGIIFDVSRVDDNYCELYVRTSGDTYKIPRTELERAYELGPASTLSTLIIRQADKSGANPSYVLAILNYIEDETEL